MYAVFTQEPCKFLLQDTRFSGNDQDVLCVLDDISLSGSSTSNSFDLVARHYNLNKELIKTVGNENWNLLIEALYEKLNP